MAVTRSLVLDYFDVVVARTPTSHRLFAFETTREVRVVTLCARVRERVQVGQAERTLLTDLALHCGFDSRYDTSCVHACTESRHSQCARDPVLFDWRAPRAARVLSGAGLSA
jgi:hypothetical protein